MSPACPHHSRGQPTARTFAGSRYREQFPILHTAPLTTSTAQLYEKLRSVSAKGNSKEIEQIVEALLQERHEAPNLRLYTALILSNTDPQNGSAAKAARLLQEMMNEGINADSGTYHALLKVLAIHPDYNLRSDILEELRQRWFALSSAGWHDVVAGLLKEKQLELALDKLQQMQRDGGQVKSWLHDMFTYTLCEVEEFEAATALLKHRIAGGEMMISANLWFFFLDTAIANIPKYEATLYAWKKRVESEYLNPPSGICLNVLITAARQGDARLATDVFRVLGNRKTKFELHQYETLVEAYIGSGDVKTALTILCIMKASGLEPEEGSTRSLFQHFRQNSQRPKEAFDMLRDLRKAGRAVPTSAVNSVIEASVHLEDLSQAINHYKQLHTVSPDGPNTATFNALFRGCNTAHRKDLAMFLAAEMLALKVAPDALTYDRLLIVCLDHDDYEDAFRYFAEMKGRGWMPRQGTLVAMVKKCAERGDGRAFDVFHEIQGEGMETGKIRKWLRENWAGPADAARMESL
ncbi:MAG: hypothetical protein M1830_008958 [Pleopsidium flavum]|nr:MAG: hypothetical protein M1830_008958 [Pleopsidium flavum]